MRYYTALTLDELNAIRKESYSGVSSNQYFIECDKNGNIFLDTIILQPKYMLTIEHEFKLIKVNIFPIMYRGAEINPTAGYNGGYDWYHDDYSDGDFDGESWHYTGGGNGPTIKDCKHSIDILIDGDE